VGLNRPGSPNMPIKDLIEKIKNHKLEQWMSLVGVLAFLGLAWAALEALRAVLPGLGGIGACVAAFAAIKNWRVAEDRRATDLFVKAAEMLGNEKSLEVRLAGIYSLERIARDFPDDHWTVMELLMTFVRGKPARPRAGEISEGTLGGSSWQRWSDPASPDIDAALGVISQRSIIEGKKLKLRLANLGGVTFEEKANFQGADLKEANLYQASLPVAIFRDASLVWADLRYAALSGADFTNANLSSVDLRSADITGAIFKGADLSDAVFDRRNKGMDVDQIMAAKNWENAHYDNGFAIKLAKLDAGFAKRLAGRALVDHKIANEMSIHDPVFTKQLGLSSTRHPRPTR